MHTGLVFNEVKRWRWALETTGLTLDDLMSAGYEGIAKAITKYDESTGKFSTYAVYWVRHYIRRMVDSAKVVHVPCHISQEARQAGNPVPAPFGWESLDNEDEESYEMDFEGGIDTKTNIEVMKAGIAQLSESHRHVLVAVSYKDQPYRQIADELGVTITRVAQLYKQAMVNMKKYMEEHCDE